MKVRLKFTKIDSMKFIGHLDLMRMFQKIFRLANIPIEYSKGFNPHQIFSIAAPLSVGITSEGEYLDMKLYQDMNLTEMIEQINAVCPNGICILDAIKLDDSTPAGMAQVSAAKYVITQVKPVITNEAITSFIEQRNIIINRKTKKGILKEVDIKPGIFNLSVNNDIIIITIATGSNFNIKPEALIESFLNFIDIDYNPFNFKIHREELYQGNIELIPLSYQF